MEGRINLHASPTRICLSAHLSAHFLLSFCLGRRQPGAGPQVSHLFAALRHHGRSLPLAFCRNAAARGAGDGIGTT